MRGTGVKHDEVFMGTSSRCCRKSEGEEFFTKSSTMAAIHQISGAWLVGDNSKNNNEQNILSSKFKV